MQSNPTLVVKNNTPFDQQINLLETTAGSQGAINQNREFVFNMSCEGFLGTNKISIQSKLNGDVSYQTYTADLSDPSLNTAVAALNTLGIGTFYAYTDESGAPLIIIYNSEREYTNLTLFNSNGLQAAAHYSINVFYNNTGYFKAYANCEEVFDYPFPEVNEQGANYDFGTKIKLVVKAGDNTSPEHITQLSVSTPSGQLLISHFFAPNEELTFQFVIDEPSPGATNYFISILDNI